MRIRTGVTRSATAMLVAVFAMAMMVLPAAAQEYPPEGETGDASGPSTVEPGSSPTFQAAGFDANADVAVTVFGVLSATATVTANEQGVAAYTVTVPCDTRAGDAQIEFSGPGAQGVNSAGMTFTVTEDSEACVAGDGDQAGAPQPEEEGLAATGGEITTGLGIAAVVLLAGAAMVVTTRNRRNESVDA